jgi:FkbM family methyltransferase
VAEVAEAKVRLRINDRPSAMTRLKVAIQAILRLTLRIPGARCALRTMVRRARIPERITQRLPVECGFVIQHAGLQLEYFSAARDGVGRALYWQGLSAYEPETLPLLTALARRSGVMLDVGANTGVFSLWALNAAPDVEVHAFEPSPAVFAALERNVAANGLQERSRLNPVAVADTEGDVTLHVPVETWASASLDRHGFHGLSGETVEVPATTLDAYVRALSIERVDLLKVDVEGFEHLVLAGAAKVLRDQRPFVICECLPGAQTQTLEEILRAAGYRIYRLESAGAVKLDGIVPDRSGAYKNFLFLPEERELPSAREPPSARTAQAAAGRRARASRR